MEIPFRDPAALEAFCMPYVRGEKTPATPAELMACRYVAYATGAVDYLIATHDPKTRGQTDRKATKEWSESADWKGLEILKTEGGGADDDEGHVEFIARYAMNGTDHTHHERSLFRKVDGRWYFVSGDKVASAPQRKAEPKIGRNDACPCGSGRKYKKCCGAAA